MNPRSHLDLLRLAGRLTAPTIHGAIHGLEIRPGSSILDMGSGTGQHALWLADQTGPAGRVCGVDLCAEHVAAARTLSGDRATAGGIYFIEGDMHQLPFPDGCFDLVWCADTLWPVSVAEDPAVAVRELARVLKPGGRLVLCYWSGQCLLPGHPRLEAALNLAFAKTTPYLAHVGDHHHFLRAASWLRGAGLHDVAVRTFVTDIQGPLTTEIREAVAACLDMLWGGVESQVAERDWRDMQRLRGDGEWERQLDRTDYYGFITHTQFCGLRLDDSSH